MRINKAEFQAEIGVSGSFGAVRPLKLALLRPASRASGDLASSERTSGSFQVVSEQLFDRVQVDTFHH